MKNDMSLGIGIGLGACATWLVFELWPLFVIGGAGFIALKSLASNSLSKEEVVDAEFLD